MLLSWSRFLHSSCNVFLASITTSTCRWRSKESESSLFSNHYYLRLSHSWRWVVHHVRLLVHHHTWGRLLVRILQGGLQRSIHICTRRLSKYRLIDKLSCTSEVHMDTVPVVWMTMWLMVVLFLWFLAVRLSHSFNNYNKLKQLQDY